MTIYRRQSLVRALLVTLLTTLPSAAIVRAQGPCQQWREGDGVPGVNGSVLSSILWDPDGQGPRSPLVVFSGSFTVAGSIAAANIAAWDGVSWSSFGSGLTQPSIFFEGGVGAMTIAPNGELIAGGNFTLAGGTQVSNVARWNGATWSAVGAGFDGPVFALATLPTGELVAGGRFSHSGSVAVSNIAIWNGVFWQPMGQGVNGTVRTLAARPSGGIVVGGEFSRAGSVSASAIANWNDGVWTAFDNGFFVAPVTAVHVRPDGTILAHTFRWNGSSWVPLGAFPPMSFLEARSHLSLPNGDLIVVGIGVGQSGQVSDSVWKWDGNVWTSLGFDSGVFFIQYAVQTAVLSPQGDLIVGGGFPTAGGVAAIGVARKTATSWAALGSGMNGQVNALAPMLGGRLAVGGQFTSAGGTAAYTIAQWNGLAWSPIGAGFEGSPGTAYVRDLITLSDGSLVAGGYIQYLRGTSFSVATGPVARWDGAQWTRVPGANANSTFGMTARASGQFACALETFSLLLWNGSSFADLGYPAQGQGFVSALATFPNNDIVAGGSFENIGGVQAESIARWHQGQGWTPLGTGISGLVHTMLALPSGELITGGDFLSAGSVSANYVARWNGSAWSPLGEGVDGRVYSLASTPSGSVIVGGDFQTAGSAPARNIALWNGSVWTPLGTGLDAPPNAIVSFDPDGPGPRSPLIVAGGNFGTAGGKVSPYFAVWGPPSDSVWAPPAGGGNGSTTVNANWACSAIPDSSQTLMFDRTVAGVNLQPFYTVTTGASITAKRLIANTDQVTLNLTGQNLTLTGGPSVTIPPLVVGDRAGGFDARLLLRNTAGNPAATLLASGLAIGNSGDPANNALLSVRDAALTARIDGNVAVGDTARGTLEVRDGATLRYGHDSESFLGSGLYPTTGTSNTSTLSIFGGGRLESALPVRVLSLGSAPGAYSVTAISGVNSRWSAQQTNLYIGDAGDAIVNINNGGQLLTSTSNNATVGRLPTSSAAITIGAGSMWNETLQSINVGGAGGQSSATITVQSDGILSASSINVFQGGVLAGSGRIDADVFNFGTLRPGEPAGTLTINGDYRQIPPSSMDSRSGLLEIEIAGTGPGQFDQLIVQGPAELGGGLTVGFVNGFNPSAGQPINFELLRANAVTRSFDVAYFPSLQSGDSRFLRTIYNRSGSVVVSTGSLNGQVNLSAPSTTSLSGVPSASAVGDINGDGKTDLAIAVSNGPSTSGDVFVLLNASTGPGNFAFVPGPTQQISVGRVPLGLAIGDLDGDARADLVVSSSVDNTVRVLLQSAAGGGQFTGAVTVLNIGAEPMGLCAANLARTGRLDIAVATAGDEALEVLLNNSTPGLPSFSRITPIPVNPGGNPSTGPRKPTTVRPFNPNNDKDLDLAVVNNGSGTVTLIENISTPGLFAVGARIEIPVGRSPVDVAAGALGATSGDDLVVANAGDGTLSVVLFDRAQGGFAFRPAVSLSVGVSPLAVVTTDIDGSVGSGWVRDIDVAVLGVDGSGNGHVRVLRNDFDGNSGQATLTLLADGAALAGGQDPYALVGDNVRRQAVQSALQYGVDLDSDGGKDLVVLTNVSTGPFPSSSGGGRGDRGVPLPVVKPIRSRAMCRGDFNGVGGVTIQDLFDFLNAWFSGQPSGDFNGVGGLTIQDVFDFLAAWFSPC